MQVIGIALAIIGSLIALAGYIWLVVTAFQKGGVGWGIGSLLIGLIGLIFAITHWEDAKRPFLTEIGGVVVLIIGYALIGVGAASSSTSLAF